MDIKNDKTEKNVLFYLLFRVFWGVNQDLVIFYFALFY